MELLKQIMLARANILGGKRKGQKITKLLYINLKVVRFLCFARMCRKTGLLLRQPVIIVDATNCHLMTSLPEI